MEVDFCPLPNIVGDKYRPWRGLVIHHQDGSIPSPAAAMKQWAVVWNGVIQSCTIGNDRKAVTMIALNRIMPDSAPVTQPAELVFKADDSAAHWVY